MRRPAPEDLPGIRRLLEDGELPTADIQDQDMDLFLVEEIDGELLAVGGLERCGRSALLRSVAVRPGQRSAGLGRMIVATLEQQALAAGIGELFLLTDTAERYFLALGYSERARDTAPALIRASQQFSSLCPESAILMSKRLS